MNLVNLLFFVIDPTTFEETIMKEEPMTIHRNETWEKVDLPKGKNVIGLK